MSSKLICIIHWWFKNRSMTGFFLTPTQHPFCVNDLFNCMFSQTHTHLRTPTRNKILPFIPRPEQSKQHQHYNLIQGTTHSYSSRRDDKKTQHAINYTQMHFQIVLMRTQIIHTSWKQFKQSTTPPPRILEITCTHTLHSPHTHTLNTKL